MTLHLAAPFPTVDHAAFTTHSEKIAIEGCAGCGRGVRVGINCNFPSHTQKHTLARDTGVSAFGVNSRKLPAFSPSALAGLGVHPGTLQIGKIKPLASRDRD